MQREPGCDEARTLPSFREAAFTTLSDVATHPARHRHFTLGTQRAECVDMKPETKETTSATATQAKPMGKAKDPARGAYVTREAIMKLLSDQEAGSVSTAESTTKLASGEEYVDLEHLEAGVQKAPLTRAHMGNVLPKSAVHADTWTKVVAALSAKA